LNKGTILKLFAHSAAIILLISQLYSGTQFVATRQIVYRHIIYDHKHILCAITHIAKGTMQTLFTTKEAHEQLRVSMPTIRSWIHQGRLPVVRLGRRVFIHESVLEKIIREGLDSVDKNP